MVDKVRQSPHTSHPSVRAASAQADKPKNTVKTSSNPDVQAANGQSRFDAATRATPAQQKQAVDRVHDAESALDHANDKTQQLDKKLQGELAHVGAGLTAKEKAAYVRAFHQKYKDDYSKEAKAARELKTALRSPALAGKTSELVKGYSALAKSSEAKAALDWARHAFTTKGSPLYHSDTAANIAGTAASNAAAGIIAHAKSPAEAMKELKTELAPFIDAGKAGKRFGDLKGAWAAAEAASKGDYSKYKTLAQKWDEKSPLFKAVAVIGVTVGAQAAVGAAAQHRYTEAVKDLANSGKAGLQIVAGVSHSIAQNERLAQLVGGAKAAEQIGKLASRFAPALGVVASSAAFVQDLRSLQHGNPAAAISLVGDALSVAGSALEATPLAPLGGLINGIGTALSAVGSLFTDIFKDRAMDHERTELLEKAGVPSDIAKVLANHNSQTSKLGDYGMSPEQIQSLIKHHHDLLEYGNYFSSMLDAAKVVGVKPRNFEKFVNLLHQRFHDDENAGMVLNEIKQNAMTSPVNTDWRKQLRQYVLAVIPDAKKLT